MLVVLIPGARGRLSVGSPKHGAVGLLLMGWLH